MPTNVTAEYKKNEAAYRKARDPKERLNCLREMLRTIPKHKGTEHLQADIKTRIKELTMELAGPKKGGARTGPPQAVRAEGAAQIALIGPPNSGKSTLLAHLTGAKTEIGPYPLTTRSPIPGMLPHEDIHFQLVDLPPISVDYMESWFVNALQTADAAILVFDVSNPACVENIGIIRDRLHEKKVTFVEHWPADRDAPAIDPSPDKNTDGDDLADPFRLHLPTLLLANKKDLGSDPEEIQVLEELLGVHYPAFAVSAKTGEGLNQLGPFFFAKLQIVRVYTKAPGREADNGRPYTLRQGDTIKDVARLVHKDIAASLKFAKVWGSGRFAGQQVGPEHVVADKDIVELHQ